MIEWLQQYNKLIAALIGAVGVAVAQGLVPEEVGSWLTVVIAFLTAAGVYVVPNKQPDIDT